MGDISVLLWIVGSGLAMAAIALVGAITTVVSERTLEKILLPLVALAAGALLGGALFHLIPAGVEAAGNQSSVYVWVAAGFVVFFLLEQFLHWHHCHRVPSEHKTPPLSHLLLIADGLHNLIGGLAVGGAFVLDIRLGISAWLAAAAHEIPQELGDFGVLVYGGWSKRRALFFNVVSALTFPLGGVLAWVAAKSIDIDFLLPFAAGNFIYIAAADLIPEVKKNERWTVNMLHFGALLLGLFILLGTRLAFQDG
ncbi:MAG: ZIP family metal transporter [Persicimonas sp.]